MPTGYTADVQSGAITEFEDFAWRCARGMGALIMMRDEPSNAPIPERFEPSVAYHDQALQKARTRLAEMRAMGPLQAREAAQQHYADRKRSEDDYVAGKRQSRQRYESMLAKVEAWEPPTGDHIGLKSFMLSQPRDSIDFDCSEGGYLFDPPKKLEPDAWRDAEIAKAERDIEYHTTERQKEINRTELRNQWLIDLRGSLA